MERRDFLRLVALGTAGRAACRLPRAGAAPPTKRVIVIGAGLAGLVAGYALAQAGHDVTIVEASARPGGRIQTLSTPFSDGLHAETGGLFVPNNHDLTLRYARLFGLSLQPAVPLFEARLFYVRGQRVVANWGKEIVWPFDLTQEERDLGRQGLWDRYVGGDASAALSQDDLDRMSVAQLLRARGASPEVVALLRVGFLDMMGDGIESYSALQMQQRLALMRGARQLYTIAGGSELLPTAIAESLKGKIRYESPVERIERGDASASVFVGRERLTADRVVCTMPFSVLKDIAVSPPFSTEKSRAIAQLPYTSVVRVFLQFRRRPWTDEQLYLLTTTDLAMKWMYDHTVNQPGPRGILEAQAFGADARRLARLPEADRIEFALSQVEQVFPGARADYERGVSKVWDQDPWARGAFAYFRPGQMLALRPHIAEQEGRVHFAGDHTSAWSGWMQGAIESGMRAALEVTQAP